MKHYEDWSCSLCFQLVANSKLNVLVFLQMRVI